MGQIGSNPPTSTRAEASDVMVGNFLDENPGVTTDITIAGLRRSDLNYDTESISNAVRFLTGGTVKGQFYNNGNFGVLSGDIIIGTAGKGLDFSNQASPAAGMTSELFNHYEEGTWTAAMVSGGGTWTLASAYYIRMGSFVSLVALFSGSGKTATANTSYISGSPFAPIAQSAGGYADATAQLSSGHTMVHTSGNIYPDTIASTNSVLTFSASFRI